MRKQECVACGCAKSEHTSTVCKICLITYHDNYKEYMQAYEYSTYVSPWHSFKLDNLKYLEQCYEARTR